MKKLIFVLFTILILLFWCFTVKADNQALDEELVYEYCCEIGYEYSICPELLMAIAEKESMLNPNANNGTCKGLMQISEKWHKSRMKKLGVTDLYDPYGNILVAADYIMELAEKYESITLVLDIYNGNSNAFENERTGTMSDYATKILKRAEELERLHETFGTVENYGP